MTLQFDGAALEAFSIGVCCECPLVLLCSFSRLVKWPWFVFAQYMQSWVPEKNPCLICMCLDQQRINCTARPCNDIKGKLAFGAPFIY